MVHDAFKTSPPVHAATSWHGSIRRVAQGGSATRRSFSFFPFSLQIAFLSSVTRNSSGLVLEQALPRRAFNTLDDLVAYYATEPYAKNYAGAPLKLVDLSKPSSLQQRPGKLRLQAAKAALNFIKRFAPCRWLLSASQDTTLNRIAFWSEDAVCALELLVTGMVNADSVGRCALFETTHTFEHCVHLFNHCHVHLAPLLKQQSGSALVTQYSVGKNSRLVGHIRISAQ